MSLSESLRWQITMSLNPIPKYSDIHLHLIRPSFHQNFKRHISSSLSSVILILIEYGSTSGLIKSVFVSVIQRPLSLLSLSVLVESQYWLMRKSQGWETDLEPTPSAETIADKAQRQATVLPLYSLLSPANALSSLLSHSFSSKGPLSQIWHLVHSMRLSLCHSVRKIQIFLQLMCLAFFAMPQWVPMWNPAHNYVNSFVLIIRTNSCHP